MNRERALSRGSMITVLVLITALGYAVGSFNTMTFLNQEGPSLQVCVTEDSDNCIWDASVQGDGTGSSFIAYRGEVYYLER